MSAAEIENYNESAMPYQEVVRLNADDNETYITRKFDVILAVAATKNAADNAHIQADFTGKTVTIRYDSASSDDMTLVIYGKSGP